MMAKLENVSGNMFVQKCAHYFRLSDASKHSLFAFSVR